MKYMDDRKNCKEQCTDTLGIDTLGGNWAYIPNKNKIA